MEPVDVIHAEYRMWDATGMAYELGVVGARVRAEPNVVNLEELRDALRSRSGQSARLAPGDEPQEVARRLL